MGVESMVIWKF